jgi:hypothetical protein
MTGERAAWCTTADERGERGTRMRSLLRTLVVLVGVLAPVAAFAQDGTIAGVVRDPSGAVLPGVTVEASSSVLLEKVRTVVTDGTGQYNIVALPPGTSPSVQLPGFSVLWQENIQLTAVVDDNPAACGRRRRRYGDGRAAHRGWQRKPAAVLDGDVQPRAPTSRS